MLAPIYVPSRGRAGKSPTIAALQAEDIPVKVVVGLEDAEAYYDIYGMTSVIATETKGIGRVRQQILTHARAHHQEFIWMVDDDISALFELEEGPKYRRVSWGYAMLWMEHFVRDNWQMGIGAIGPMARQFGWSASGPSWNRRLGYMILLWTGGPWNYWPHFHEDTDMTLQILTNGYRTVLHNRFGYSTPAMGTLEGGCQDGYREGEGIKGGELLVQKWEGTHPGLVRVVQNKAGATVTRVDWKRFNVEEGGPVKDAAARD